MADMQFLHCECEQCTHWEVAQAEDGTRYLICKTCDLRLPVKIEIEEHGNLLDCHPKLYWSERE